jgi:hypothetical protein
MPGIRRGFGAGAATATGVAETAPTLTLAPSFSLFIISDKAPVDPGGLMVEHE